MHVNTNFKGVSYPATSIELRDPYTALSYTFVPLEGLSNVARSLVANQPSSSSPTADELGRHAKDPQQLPGARSLIAIVDTSNASAFNFPVAAIRNAAGTDVTPTPAAMTAELNDMTKTSAGTLVPNPASTDPAAYPLTMVQYAMVPTGNTPAATVSKVAAFLSYAADKGQLAGSEGGLPAGYLPLTSTLKAQLTTTLAAVRSQSDTVTSTGDRPPSGPNAPGAGSTPQVPTDNSFGGNDGGSTDTSSTPDTGASAPTPTVASPAPKGATKGGATEHVTAVNFTPPKTSAGAARLVIPLVIAAAVSTALLGPLLLSLGNPDSAVSVLLGRARGLGLPWRRS
jgi:phage terminase large subunit-like protein